jgi:hypothetical protein
MRIFLCLCVLLVAAAARAEKLSLVGGTVIKPAEGKVLPNATIVINGDKIEAVVMGKQNAAALGKQIDCKANSFCPATSTPTSISSNRPICSHGRTARI